MSAMQCALCKNTLTTPVYAQKGLPVFQNIVYDSVSGARSSAMGDLQLVLCNKCGLVFNEKFDPCDLKFDGKYENEQGHSGYYQNYLASIIDLFKQQSLQNKKIVEIGCGKGFFVEQLIQAGFSVKGFDPAYTGDNPNIEKKYFDRSSQNFSADIIVLRHMLAHIQNPLDFLHLIADAVDYNAKIYIEVASLDWILENSVFWDIYYENCNYFTKATLSSLFDYAQVGSLFNEQCSYLIADLKDLRKTSLAVPDTQHCVAGFEKLMRYVDYCRQTMLAKSGIALWGAAGKGVAFANLIDPEAELVSYLIDINPKKQQQFIAKTAHKIISPAELKEFKIKDILVMNDNYLAEIQAVAAPLGIKVLPINSL